MSSIEWEKLDATGYILGRLASKVAKMALEGHHIVITNAARAQISGNKNFLVKRYLTYKHVKTASNPRRGPFRVGTRPDIFLRKTIKGMLPKNWRGEQAYHRIHVYIYDIPEEKKNKYGEPKEIELGPKFRAERLMHKKMSVEELCEIIGWNRGGMK